MKKEVVRVEETLDQAVTAGDGPTPEEPSTEQEKDTDGTCNTPQKTYFDTI